MVDVWDELNCFIIVIKDCVVLVIVLKFLVLIFCDEVSVLLILSVLVLVVRKLLVVFRLIFLVGIRGICGSGFFIVLIKEGFNILEGKILIREVFVFYVDRILVGVIVFGIMGIE